MRLDSGDCGTRVSANDQLAVDEERVGRAVDQKLAGACRLEHHPRPACGPAEQIEGPRLVGDRHTRQADALACAIAVDEQRATVLGRHYAHHRGFGAARKQKKHYC